MEYMLFSKPSLRVSRGGAREGAPGDVGRVEGREEGPVKVLGRLRRSGIEPGLHRGQVAALGNRRVVEILPGSLASPPGKNIFDLS